MDDKYIWNVDLPIKLFDTDIDNEKFLEYIKGDELFKTSLSTKTIFILEHKTNQYPDCQLIPQNYVGVVNNIHIEDGILYANVSMFTNLPYAYIIKKTYDLLHTDDNSVFYLTPHGTKENGRIIDISNFTLWHYPSHQNDTLGKMEMTTL